MVAHAQSLIEFSEVTKKGKFGEKTVSITSQELARLRAAASGAPAPTASAPKLAPKAAPKPAPRPAGEPLRFTVAFQYYFRCSLWLLAY